MFGGLVLGTPNFDRSKFHFFDDAAEWVQMDKAAHAFNAYFLSRWEHEVDGQCR